LRHRRSHWCSRRRSSSAILAEASPMSCNSASKTGLEGRFFMGLLVHDRSGSWIAALMAKTKTQQTPITADQHVNMRIRQLYIQLQSLFSEGSAFIIFANGGKLREW